MPDVHCAIPPWQRSPESPACSCWPRVSQLQRKRLRPPKARPRWNRLASGPAPTIPQAKSGRRETIPINSEALKALTKLRSFAPVKSNDPNATLQLHVCPDPDEWHHRLRWTPAREAATITDFCWLDLRHTFASRLVMNGVDILTVNKLLRHKTLQVTMRYAHLAATHLHDAMGRLASVTKRKCHSARRGGCSNFSTNPVSD